MGNASGAAAIIQVREQPSETTRPEDRGLIVRYNEADEIAREIDVILCDACGLLRMGVPDNGLSDGPRKGPHEMRDDDPDLPLPRDVVAALISQVRQDIGRLTHEHRESMQTLDRRLDDVYEDVRTLQRAKDLADGKSDGMRTVIGYLIALSGLAGALIAWIAGHLPWNSGK